MDWLKLQTKLLAAARHPAPAEEVPSGFEKRVMARLLHSARPDECWSWIRAFWLGAAACASLTVLVGAWSMAAPPDRDTPPSFTQDLEQTLLPATAEGESAW
jgi:hypothetical protein